MLQSMDAVEGATVADLFAGTGALGVEAASRGAERVVLVEQDPEAVAVIRRNLEVLGADARRCEVVRADAVRWAAGGGSRFDLVLADPPYRFDRWAELLGLLAGRVGLLVAETGSPWEPGPGWETVKVRTYGGTVVAVARPGTPVPVAGAEEGES